MLHWQPCGLITLTTDYGLVDPFVGVLKGRILQRFFQARIIDLTHAVPAFRPQLAGFWLARSCGWFPAGSVHVAVVDPGVGTPRRIVALQGVLQGVLQCWLAPDNGLLQPVLQTLQRAGGEPVIHHCEPARFERFGICAISATFHGRDVFAPLAAELASGRCGPGELGPRLPASELAGTPHARAREDAGSVIAIDHYGNLITDIEAPAPSSVARLQVRAAGRVLPFLRTYGDVPPGDYLALVNAFGVVEIARREASAAQGLALDCGAPVDLVAKS